MDLLSDSREIIRNEVVQNKCTPLRNKLYGTFLSLQSTPDNSNLQGKEKVVLVTGSSSYRGWNYIESDLTGNVNCFELARGLS